MKVKPLDTVGAINMNNGHYNIYNGENGNWYIRETDTLVHP